jgi:hypothetical protein
MCNPTTPVHELHPNRVSLLRRVVAFRDHLIRTARPPCISSLTLMARFRQGG